MAINLNLMAKMETHQANWDHNREMLDRAIRHAEKKSAEGMASTSTASMGSNQNTKTLGRAASTSLVR